MAISTDMEELVIDLSNFRLNVQGQKDFIHNLETTDAI